MQVRPAASNALLSETMAKVVEIPDWQALLDYLQEHYSFWNPTKDNVAITPYGYDDRIEWNTYIITIDGKAALFSNGPLKKEIKNMSQDNKFPTVNVDALIKLVLADAHQKRESSGQGGHHHDGGASVIETQVKFYNYGRAGRIPTEWKVFESQLDPEYQEFQRLKQKFGNK